ncbi:hypothetical protein B0H67DRAFT_106638 [Lasiosphaeris hirsuta]|uniref:Uncharacterized protein n=1 Tax=Lasiosphaeris hirsuta TaxID=260670 RepID=A0AA40AYP4_9PEZI|nr:hypothetical protein B0H67DRAFT_106638 [Lasiosphaeris hirsuta]
MLRGHQNNFKVLQSRFDNAINLANHLNNQVQAGSLLGEFEKLAAPIDVLAAPNKSAGSEVLRTHRRGSEDPVRGQQYELIRGRLMIVVIGAMTVYLAIVIGKYPYMFPTFTIMVTTVLGRALYNYWDNLVGYHRQRGWGRRRGSSRRRGRCVGCAGGAGGRP